MSQNLNPRARFIEYTGWNDGDKRLTENIMSALYEGKLKEFDEMYYYLG